MIAIEKGIPIPPKGNNQNGRPTKYPLDEMDVGDSFYCHPNVNTKKAALSLRWSIAVCGRRLKGAGKAFTSRMLIVEERFLIRCWRIK